MPAPAATATLPPSSAPTNSFGRVLCCSTSASNSSRQEAKFRVRILAPYSMETRVLVQTLETPTEATGSSSEGTRQIWQIFQLGARPSIPPGLRFSQNPPPFVTPRAVSCRSVSLCRTASSRSIMVQFRLPPSSCFLPIVSCPSCRRRRRMSTRAYEHQRPRPVQP